MMVFVQYLRVKNKERIFFVKKTVMNRNATAFIIWESDSILTLHV